MIPNQDSTLAEFTEYFGEETVKRWVWREMLRQQRAMDRACLQQDALKFATSRRGEFELWRSNHGVKRSW